MSRNMLIIIVIVAALVCGYDVFFALRGSIISWVLAAIMGVIALLCLRKLVRQDYSGSWW